MISNNAFVKKRTRSVAVFRTWARPLEKFLNTQYVEDLSMYLENKYLTSNLIRPKLVDIFNPFKFCKYSSLKMVLITNCNMYQTNSNGVGLGVEKGTTPPYVVDCLKNCINETFYKHTDAPLFDETLTDYARQGILMLNSSLTTQVTEDSQIIWRNFIRNVIMEISSREENIAFVFLTEGNEHFEKYIDVKKHKIFKNNSFTLSPSSSVLREADEYIFEHYDKDQQIEW